MTSLDLDALRRLGIVVGVFALLGAGLFGYGWHRGRKAAISAMKPETDTLVIFDTVVHDRPVHDTLWRYADRFVEVPAWDTVQVHHHDTTVIMLPKEVVEYKKPDYYARVSGYHPNLDYIEFYQETKVIENRVNVPGPARRWGIGIHAGYGLTYADGFRMAPEIGIGLQYNIIAW